MSTVRNASDALSPSSGPIEFADGMRAAIDTLASQYDRNGKRGWQPAEARGLEKELHTLAAAAGVAAEEMEKEAARKNMALVAQAAEKVAKEEPLYLQEDDELWRELDGTAFESALQVDPEHGVSPVKLIDMRFIIALGELGGTMVRRQDLPKEAFIDLDTLTRLKCIGSHLLIISISHPWQQPDHPDPKEVNLQLLAKVMKLMLDQYKEHFGGSTFAVFFE